jgi:iron complex transport system ATP-binding protein
VLGNRFGEVDLREVRRDVRLVQPAGPYDIDANLTAREVVLTGFFSTLWLYDAVTDEMIAEADRLLGQVGLAHVADHSYATLSSGERVRSLIARALVLKPRVLLLDEPTAGLDLLAREQVLATVAAMFEGPAGEEGGPPTVVLITHHVEELSPVTSEVLLLDEGRVAAAGGPEAVLRAEVLSRVYRCALEVSRQGGAVLRAGASGCVAGSAGAKAMSAPQAKHETTPGSEAAARRRRGPRLPPAGSIAAVAAGGMIGAGMRHGFTVLFPAVPGSFPLTTFAENVTGAFLLGLLLVLILERLRPSRHVHPFLCTGILGSFTTFSTFSFEMIELMQTGHPLTAGTYAAASVFAGLLAALAGMRLARRLPIHLNRERS